MKYCYIAAPFFNPTQVERVEFVKSVLKEQGIDFFSPKDHCVVCDINSKEERQKCFEDNIFHIEDADFVIAITDGKGGEYYQPDAGTVFECGFAYARAIPIIYFAETLGDKQFNLMLAESGTKVCTTRESLTDLDLNNVEDLTNDYVGSIE